MAHDVIILGAGGAGLMCAIHAARRGRRVLVLDHAAKLGGKILISGGGRCNFTNTGASPAQYLSSNPHFCKSALSRYPSETFVRMVEAHGIAYHEKKLGQLFCDGSAAAIVTMLKAECDQAGAEIRLGRRILGVEKLGDDGPSPGASPGSAPFGPRFAVATADGHLECESLVVATGGLSIPKLGATGLGYDIARQFGLALVETAPALDGFTFSDADMKAFGGLAGLSADCVMSAGGKSFRENLLFTHGGLSGPASLQASLHWRPGEPVRVDLSPERDVGEWLVGRKREGAKGLLKNLVSEILPSRLAERFCELYSSGGADTPLHQLRDQVLLDLGRQLKEWTFVPSGTVGYSKAEVTRGGVNTDELSSKTLEARRVPGLYFVGEVVDVTGWLGGYNFQWAWASGWAAGQVV